MRLKYSDLYDVSKFMIFHLPDGEYTIQIQVKSKTPSFYPKLYIKYYPDIEDKLKSLEFPPGGEPNYFISNKWDYKLGILNYYEKFEGIKGGKSGLALNLFDASKSRENSPDAEAYITISTSSVVKMLPE
jgi:hypothetical protein